MNDVRSPTVRKGVSFERARLRKQAPNPIPIDIGTRLDRYEIRSRIGEGGMGEVYLAQDTRLGRDGKQVAMVRGELTSNAVLITGFR